MTNLDAIRQRLEAATPGPWGETCGILKHYVWSGGEEDLGFSLQELHPHDGREVPAHANAEFIAHAWQDISDLLDLVDRQRAALDELSR